MAPNAHAPDCSATPRSSQRSTSVRERGCEGPTSGTSGPTRETTSLGRGVERQGRMPVDRTGAQTRPVGNKETVLRGAAWRCARGWSPVGEAVRRRTQISWPRRTGMDALAPPSTTTSGWTPTVGRLWSTRGARSAPRPRIHPEIARRPSTKTMWRTPTHSRFSTRPSARSTSRCRTISAPP